MRAALLLLLAGALPAHAADIVEARYDAARDQLEVTIDYRGTNPDHGFDVQWGECSSASPPRVVGRLIDRQGSDSAREDYRTTERVGLDAMPCRPAIVTLRLGRVSHVDAFVPGMPGEQLAPDAAIEASTLIGMEVRNTATGASGRIRDLVIDIANNRVHYAELDMPGRLFAAPPGQLALSPQGAAFTPGERSIEPRAGMELVRASTLIGWEVTDEPGERVGRIVDLAIDAAGERVPFAVLQLEDAAGGAPLRAIPTDALALYAQRESIVLTRPTAGRVAVGESATTAAAGGTRSDERTLFERLDKDGDGYLSDAEVDRPIAGSRNWMAIDLDRDGRISREEFTPIRP